MIGTNALALQLNDTALHKIATVWIENTDNEFNLGFRNPVPVNLTLVDLHLESLKITPKGIDGWVKTGIQVHQKILRRDFEIKGIVRVHFVHKLIIKDGVFLSRTKMIEFKWIRHPRLLVQDKFQTNLTDKLDLIISKFNEKVFKHIDKKIEGEIRSDTLSRILNDYLNKTTFFQTWKSFKPTLSVSNLNYRQSQIKIDLQLFFGAKVDVLENYQFNISYPIVDEFLTYLLKEQIGLWPVFRISQITTGLLGPVVFTKVKFNLRFLGSLGIEWEFSSMKPRKPVTIGIKKMLYQNWSLPKFLGGWILKRVSRIKMKMGSQLIQQMENGIASKFGKSELTVEARELPVIVDISPNREGIVVSVKEPQRIIIS